jgi:hypothetical protein
MTDEAKILRRDLSINVQTTYPGSTRFNPGLTFLSHFGSLRRTVWRHQRRAPLFPPGKLVRGSFRHIFGKQSAIKNNAHLKKETTIRTEFGGAHDRGAFAGGLVEGKTLKGAHLNLPAFHLAGNLDNFPLHLE